MNNKFSKSSNLPSNRNEPSNTKSIPSNSHNFSETTPVKLNYSLNEGCYISEGVKIINLFKETEHSKFYLALIEEIDEIIVIKAVEYNPKNYKDKQLISTFSSQIEKVYKLCHDNILSYYDFKLFRQKTEQPLQKNPPLSKSSSLLWNNIVLIYMENFQDSISLSTLMYNHNKKNPKMKGLKMIQIIPIIKGLLNALQYLHKNDIIHRRIIPKYILMNENLTKIKLVKYALNTNEFNVQTFSYYSSPELSLNIKATKACDIWSVGCVLFEMFTGYRPYCGKEGIDPLFCHTQGISPIEAANDELKDLLYEKKNRVVLNFMLQCFRPIQGQRPFVEELLKHPFLKNENEVNE
jgi:serine/threonine protein kinase